jgi:hypothetical protein
VRPPPLKPPAVALAPHEPVPAEPADGVEPEWVPPVPAEGACVPVDAPPVPPPHAANASPGAAKASAATKAAPANNAPYEGVRLCLRLMVCI